MGGSGEKGNYRKQKECQDGQSWNNKAQDPRKRKVIRNFRQDETTVQERQGLSKKKTQNMVWFEVLDGVFFFLILLSWSKEHSPLAQGLKNSTQQKGL